MHAAARIAAAARLRPGTAQSMNASASGSTSASANCAPTMMPMAIPSITMRLRFQRNAARGA